MKRQGKGKTAPGRKKRGDPPCPARHLECQGQGQEDPQNAVCAYLLRLELILKHAVSGNAALLAHIALYAQVDGERKRV